MSVAQPNKGEADELILRFLEHCHRRQFPSKTTTAGLLTLAQSVFELLDPLTLAERWEARGATVAAIVAQGGVVEKTAANQWSAVMQDIERAHPSFIRPERPKSEGGAAKAKAAQRAKPVDPAVAAAEAQVKALKAASTAKHKALAAALKEIRAEADKILRASVSLKHAAAMLGRL